MYIDGHTRKEKENKMAAKKNKMAANENKMYVFFTQI